MFRRRVYLREDYSDRKYVTDYICANGKRMFYVTDTRRKGIVHSFWRLQQLEEFIEYKKVIYRSYVDYFGNETLRIKKMQYERISLEQIFGKNVYNSDMAVHIMALDKMVNSLNLEERALYSYISDVYEFDKCRKRLLSGLNEWESQIKEWKDKDPKLLSLIDLILKPLDFFI